MAFFADPTITLSNKLLECVYIIIGLITIYAGVKNLLDKENPSRFGTFVFWTKKEERAQITKHYNNDRGSYPTLGGIRAFIAQAKKEEKDNKISIQSCDRKTTEICQGYRRTLTSSERRISGFYEFP